MKDRFVSRASRREWWKTSIIALLISNIATLLVALTESAYRGIDIANISEKNLPITDGFGDIAWLCALLFFLAVSIRRLHDLDESGGWAALTLFVPVIGLLVIIVWCGFGRGVAGHNRFGPAPFDQA